MLSDVLLFFFFPIFFGVFLFLSVKAYQGPKTHMRRNDIEKHFSWKRFWEKHRTDATIFVVFRLLLGDCAGATVQPHLNMFQTLPKRIL